MPLLRSNTLMRQAAPSRRTNRHGRQTWMSWTRALFTIKSEFSLAKSGQNDVEARINGLVQERSPTVRLNANTLFNGANKPARLDKVQNSPPRLPPRRYHMAVEWTAHAASYCPPSKAGARRPIFENPEFTAFVCIKAGAFHPTAHSRRSDQKRP